MYWHTLKPKPWSLQYASELQPTRALTTSLSLKYQQCRHFHHPLFSALDRDLIRELS